MKKDSLKPERSRSNVLGQKVLDIEDLWVNYENEEPQAKLDIADMILDGLVLELSLIHI